VIILGAPVMSGQLPGVGMVPVDGVYRSRRRPPRRIQVEEVEGVGAWRPVGEGEGSFGSRGLGGAFS
jgi:hypothetical protein